jgi:hypothetical protein
VTRSVYCEEDLLEGDFMAELEHDLLKNNMKEQRQTVVGASKLPTALVLSKPKMKPTIKKVVVTENQPKVDLEELGCKKWIHEIRTKSSIFTDTLLGQLLSTVVCMTCKFKSYTFEPFYSLELPVPDKPKASLKECFQEYCKEEEIGGSLWICQNCKEKRKAKKSLQIWRLPPILFIAFKRFKQSAEGCKRNDCLVNVSLIGEDLGFLASSSVPPKLRSLPKIYQPFAFIVDSTNPAPQGIDDEGPLHLLREERSQRRVDFDRRRRIPNTAFGEMQNCRRS